MAKLDDFVAGEGTIASARALAGTDDKALLAMIDTLAAQHKRAHLEALGAAGLGKAVKKAARKAAYKLKSAGVEGEARPVGATIDFQVEVALERVAIVGSPGLDGRTWLIVSELPGIQGGEIDLRDAEAGPRFEVLEEISPGQLRRHLKRWEAEASQKERPVLGDASLAARIIGRLDARLTTKPPAFEHFVAWRDAAVSRGADPDAASARLALAEAPGGAPTDEAIAALVGNHLVGYLAPPEAALAPIEDAFGALLHSDDAIEREAFATKLDELVRQAASTWWAAPGVRADVAAWLEDDADVLHFTGQPQLAVTALALSDLAAAHEGPGEELDFLLAAFKGVIDYDAAWAHRDAHIRGEAHHDH